MLLKFLVWIVLSMVIVSGNLCLAEKKVSCFETNAPSAVLMDEHGNLLYEKKSLCLSMM